MFNFGWCAKKKFKNPKYIYIYISKILRGLKCDSFFQIKKHIYIYMYVRSGRILGIHSQSKKSIEISTIQQCPLWVSRPSGIMNLAALPKKVVPQSLLEMEDMGSCVSRYRKHPVVNSFESTSHAKKLLTLWVK